MKNKILLFVLFTSLVGCSTVPTEIPKATGPAILFVRDTGLIGSGCTFDVLIDGEVVGQLRAGDSITKQVKSGRHRVGIDNATAICPNVKMSKVIEVFDSPVVFRIGTTSNFQRIFDQVQ